MTEDDITTLTASELADARPRVVFQQTQTVRIGELMEA
jgi:hypothetical protein